MALQEKYLVSNLNEPEKKEGFVTTRFTVDQITTLINASMTVVAVVNNALIAYAFAGEWSFFVQWPIFEKMSRRLPELILDGITFSTENSLQYGPVCIHEAFRGKGILELLFAEIKKTAFTHHPLGLTFINKANDRSLIAHTRKLKLTIIDDFSFNQNEYHIMAFNIKKKL